MFAFDCVATAPTPARAQGTTDPTAKNRLATATPTSPASGSAATIEKVEGPGGAARTGGAAIDSARATGEHPTHLADTSTSPAGVLASNPA